jgi:hypothetical protein
LCWKQSTPDFYLDVAQERNSVNVPCVFPNLCFGSCCSCSDAFTRFSSLPLLQAWLSFELHFHSLCSLQFFSILNVCLSFWISKVLFPNLFVGIEYLFISIHRALLAWPKTIPKSMCECSSFLHKMAYYLHITYAHSSAYF